MFGSNKPKTQRIDTLVGAQTRIIGDVHYSGGFHVDGFVKGNVDAPAESGSTLSISEGGVVEGSVAVPNVILNGVVKGDILAHDRIELGATARVDGNVYYGLIEMAIGAEINGKLVHEPPKTRSKKHNEPIVSESVSESEPAKPASTGT
jgi:cytoskeletal protein CcmA (bactofilin family)